MGLDMYIYSSPIKPDKQIGFRFNYYDPLNNYDKKQDSVIYKWRKNYALDQWIVSQYPGIDSSGNESLEIAKQHIDALDKIVKIERKKIDRFKNKFLVFKKNGPLWNETDNWEVGSILTRRVEDMESFINRAKIDLDEGLYLYYDACW